MIEYSPVGQLRRMGRQSEVKVFDRITKGLNSVEKLMAGILFRFYADSSCPAIFIKLPCEGDSSVEGMTWLKDFGETRFNSIHNLILNERPLYMESVTCDVLRVSDTVLLLVKTDFEAGVWNKYGALIELAAPNGGTNTIRRYQRCS